MAISMVKQMDLVVVLLDQSWGKTAEMEGEMELMATPEFPCDYHRLHQSARKGVQIGNFVWKSGVAAQPFVPASKNLTDFRQN